MAIQTYIFQIRTTLYYYKLMIFFFLNILITQCIKLIFKWTFFELLNCVFYTDFRFKGYNGFNVLKMIILNIY